VVVKKQQIQRLLSIAFVVGFLSQLVAIRVLTVKAIPECKGKRAQLGIVCQAFIKLFAYMLNLANFGIWEIVRGFHEKLPVSVESGISHRHAVIKTRPYAQYLTISRRQV